MEPGRGLGQPGTLGSAAGRDRGISLLCAVQARLALHRGDIAAARRELLSAHELRPLLTYANPHLAIQFRIELIRVHLALSDLAGARTLMREVDELLKRRPSMGILVGEAEALRARLSRERGSGGPGASTLTAAELRLLPLLATHMSFPEIAGELFLSPSHRQVAGDVDLPEAGCLLPPPGGHPIPGTGAPGGLGRSLLPGGSSGYLHVGAGLSCGEAVARMHLRGLDARYGLSRVARA